MFDRVQGTSATTGTGTYTLDSGAVAGFRTFYAASPAAAVVVPYVATLGSDWEVGYGEYNGANPGTLSRVEILASSNAGAAVSWGAGSKSIALAPGVGSFAGNGVRHSWDTGTTPTATDDETKGYAAGSTWRNGRGLYICIYAGTGGAIWDLISSPFRTIAVNEGRCDIAMDDSYRDPNPRFDFAVSQYRDNTFDVLKQRGARILNGGDTSGTTPIDIGISTSSGGGVIKGTMLATINTGANVRHSRAWDVVVVYRSTGSAATIIGSPSPTAIAGDAALSAATVSVSASAADILFTVTGVTGEDVTWSLAVDVNETLGP